MLKIICPNCSHTILFETPEKKPAECSFCFTAFNDPAEVSEVADENRGKISGLKFIYQQNSESFTVSGDSCIIGREHEGAQLLSGILNNGRPVISRRHCSVTFREDHYWLKDEGSSNGTFYGVNKMDCAHTVQCIEENSIIFLGKEAFLVQYQYEEKIIQPQQQEEQQGKKKIHRYRCNEGCGFETDTYVEICPVCSTCNSLVEI